MPQFDLVDTHLLGGGVRPLAGQESVVQAEVRVQVELVEAAFALQAIVQVVEHVEVALAPGRKGKGVTNSKWLLRHF